MFSPLTKYEVSTITCDEEMKVNAKCKNSLFEPPCVDLGVNTWFIYGSMESA